MRALARRFSRYPFRILILAMALLVVLEVFIFPSYVDICRENDYYCDYYATRENLAFYFARIVAKFLDDHNGTVAAVATIAIALFTWTLKRSTDKLWSAGEKQHSAINRAFVFLDGFNVELTNATDANTDAEYLPEIYKDRPWLFMSRLAVQPRWRNSGNTPTREMTINVNTRGPEGIIPPEYTYRNDSRAFFIAPGATEVGDIIEVPEARVQVDFGLTQFGEPPPVLIWGRADYKDIFDKTHFVEWSYLLRMSAPNNKLCVGFIQLASHNRSDENG